MVYFWRGLSTGGNLRFKIDWASLIVGIEFTVFALLYFVFEDNFQVQAPGEAYIWRGDLTEGFLRYEFGGLIFGGAYFRNFTVSLKYGTENRGMGMGNGESLKAGIFKYLEQKDAVCY